MIEELIEEHKEKIYSRILRDVHNEADAEEITQLVFFKAWRGLKKFRGDCAPSSWLYRIMINEIGQFMRAKKKTTLPPIDDRPLDDIHTHELGSYEMHDPINLKRMLRGLKKEERQVIKLLILGHNSRETGLIMGLTVPAVKSKKHRARLKILQNLEVMNRIKYKQKPNKQRGRPKILKFKPKERLEIPDNYYNKEVVNG